MSASLEIMGIVSGILVDSFSYFFLTAPTTTLPQPCRLLSLSFPFNACTLYLLPFALGTKSLEWADETPVSTSSLNIVYLGRFLDNSTTLEGWCCEFMTTLLAFFFLCLILFKCSLRYSLILPLNVFLCVYDHLRLANLLPVT